MGPGDEHRDDCEGAGVGCYAERADADQWRRETLTLAGGTVPMEADADVEGGSAQRAASSFPGRQPVSSSGMLALGACQGSRGPIVPQARTFEMGHKLSWRRRASPLPIVALDGERVRVRGGPAVDQRHVRRMAARTAPRPRSSQTRHVRPSFAGSAFASCGVQNGDVYDVIDRVIRALVALIEVDE